MEPDRHYKPESERQTADIVLRVTKARKGTYVRAARQREMTLKGWMCEQCDRAANFKPNESDK